MKKLSYIFIIFLVMIFSLFLVSCGEEKKPNEEKSESLEVVERGKTEYFVGDSFDPKGFVLAKVTDSGSTVFDLTLDMCDLTSFTTAGKVTINITFENLNTKIEVNVSEKNEEDTPVKMEIKTEGVKTYPFDGVLDLSGYLFLVTYKSGATLEVKGDNEKISTDITTFTEQDASYDEEVTIKYDNLVSLTITVSVLDEWDYEDYLDEVEMEEILAKLESDCEKMIPAETSDSFTLPQPSDYNFRLKLSWLSSDSKIISVTGVVNPKEEDNEVTLTLDVYKIGSATLLKHYEFKVLVKGLGPIDFEDLSNKKVVLAYFYQGTFREMSKADGNKIDIMCYCFGRVYEGELSITGLSNINTVLKWRRDYKMRVLLSIGGGASGGFSAAVKDEEARKKFVDSIMAVIKEYDFDGIDMDWEYPGWSGLADSTPYDVQNFSYLLRDLRAAMDEYKEGLLLTAAVISSSADKFYQPKELNKYLDYLNIMTYDGNNSGLATHHTKPYGSGYSAKNAIDLWINAGFDAKKIIIGAAFYGKICELETPVSNPQDALGKPAKAPSTITYTTIHNNYLNNPAFKECYDAASGAYFLSDGKYFITYDNFESIVSKANLIRDYDLAGMMFWDYGSDATGQLLSAVYSGIKNLNN
ncbi:MAG: bacterial Ig-like domain-containing protein [Bacilli bacterium]|nr:bacterial Ig-like domain-containing protein [Bacilli bacterium]